MGPDWVSSWALVGFVQKPGDHPNFRKNALGVKQPFSELSESFGIFSGQLSEFEISALGIRNSILGIRNSILGMASHGLSNPKATILGATPGAIAGIDGNPHQRFHVLHSRSVFSRIGVVICRKIGFHSATVAELFVASKEKQHQSLY